MRRPGSGRAGLMAEGRQGEEGRRGAEGRQRRKAKRDILETGTRTKAGQAKGRAR